MIQRDTPSAFTQNKSTRYELPAINFNPGETPPRDPYGRGSRPGSRHRRCHQPAWQLLRIIALLFVTVGLSAPARTQPAVEDFYKGKQINLIVGYGPGGGYDVVARLLARHLGRDGTRSPNIVVQNM